ncbi:unnamed protein product [Ixodes persulcatus]
MPSPRRPKREAMPSTSQEHRPDRRRHVQQSSSSASTASIAPMGRSRRQPERTPPGSPRPPMRAPRRSPQRCPQRSSHRASKRAPPTAPAASGAMAPVPRHVPQKIPDQVFYNSRRARHPQALAFQRFPVYRPPSSSGTATSQDIATTAASTHNLAQHSRLQKVMMKSSVVVLSVAFLMLLGVACVVIANRRERLASLVDTALSPCDNFYDYTCATWAEEHPVPRGADRVSYRSSLVDYVEKRLDEIVRAELRKVLSMPLAFNFLSSHVKAILMRNACMEVERLNDRGLGPLREVLQTLHLPEWPTVKIEFDGTQIEDVAGALGSRLGLFPLASVDVVRDPERPDKFLIAVRQQPPL